MDIKSNPNEKGKGKVNKPLIIILVAVFLVILSAASIFFLPRIINRIKQSGNPSQFSQGDSKQISPIGLNRELPENLEITEVVAEKVVGNCIETDTKFKITSAKDMKAEDLKARLAINPDTPFEVTKIEKCSFELTCEKSFARGSIVNLELRDKNGNFEYSWAFQTIDSFNIKEVLPADKSDSVPVNTGIEIIFSASPDLKETDKYFEISPEVKGEFKSYRSTLVFVPDESLKKETVYTVKIRSGMPSLDGTALENDMEFRFKTQSDENYIYCYSANKISETFLPGDQALVEMYSSPELYGNDFTVNLYQYNSAEDYYNALNDYNNNATWEQEYKFDTKGLSQVYNVTTELQIEDGGEYYTKAFLLLPDNLEKGWYIADITTTLGDRTFHIQRLIQISTVSVYSGVLPSQAVFFVNNTETGEAVSSADININLNGKNKTAKTDAKGTALMEISEDESGTAMLKITSGNDTYIDLFDYRENESDMRADYFTYVYTDREEYLTTDTVKVWGLILPRNKDVKPVPENLRLRFGYEDLDCSDVPVTVSRNGTFTAEFSFKNLKNTWGRSIALMSGDTYISGKYVSIDDYVKPTYLCVPDVPENAWMPQKNPVKAGINISFYDGTPAEGLKFSVNGYEGDIADPTEIVTDSKGYAESSVTLQDSNSWYPYESSISFSQSGVDNNYLYTYASFRAFRRDIMLESDFTRKGDVGNLEVTTSIIDKNLVEKNEKIEWGDYDKFRGDPVNTEVNAILYHSWEEKVEVGSYYNYVEKKTLKKYEYVTNTEMISSYKINTVNGKGNFADLPVKDDGTYWMDLSWNDTEGQLVEDTVYLWHGSDYYYNYYSGSYYNFNTDKSVFTENQTINLALNKNGQKVDNFEGRIFYTVSGYEFLSLNVSDTSEFSHTMTDEYIPNVNITGAYFDGKHVYPIRGSWYYYSFDPSEREIKLTVTPDKEKYAPGDTAKVKVKACDINGKVISGVPVSISVVDEAAFAIAPQNADALNDIYSTYFIPDVVAYCSFVEHTSEFNGGAERGGGGDDPVRRDFKDTAAFMEALTDSDGTTEFTVSLPDNLTTWRATVQSAGYYSDKLYAGSTKVPVIVTQPMFINPIILPQYIVGDDINFSAVCNGEASANANITAHVTGDNTDITRTASSGKPLEFGKLPKGSYKVLFTAKSGNNFDAIELPFEVVDAVLETPVLKTFDLSEESINIAPQRWPVRINFYNNKFILYSQVLNDLASSRSQRLDINIAQSYASMQLGYIDEETYLSNNVYLGDGAANLLPYSEQSYELTALICAAAPELVSREEAKSLFYNALSNPNIDSSDVAACYLGLAALSEPVLNDVNTLLSDPQGFSDNDKLMLCAALAYLGDYQNSLKYYTQFTGNINIYESGKPAEVYAFVGRSAETSGDTTRLALLTASKLNLRESELMARFLLNNKKYDQTYALELMTYLRNYEPKDEDKAKIQYTFDGKKQTLDIDTYFGTSLTFGEEQFKNSNIKVTSGSVSATAYYTGHLADIETKPTINVSKTYTSVSGDWKPGELVKVTITTSSVDRKYYTIEDTIPSGARFVELDSTDYYADRSGQRVKIYAHDTNEIVYYIRLVNSGEYITEEAFVYNSKNKWGSSERGTIVVN